MSDQVIYKTGQTVGAIEAENAIAASAPSPTISTPPVEATAIAATPTSGESNLTAVVTEPDNIPTTTVPEPEANVSNFKFDGFPEQSDIIIPEIKTPEPVPVDWKEAIKTANVKEVLKAIGVNDFAIEMDEHLKNGGDALDYLNARAIDYNKESDERLVKDDLKKQYPTFSTQQIDLMFNRRYAVGEDATDEDKDFAGLQLKADAHNKRQQLIAEQAKFKIAAPVQQSNNQEQQVAAQQRQAQLEEARQWYADHEATKALMTSKRVAIDLGESGKFNFSVDRPELLMQAVTDAKTWQKITSNKQGEPDVAKMQKIALYAFNPQQFEADLVNYGRSLALPALVKEGQNITPTAKVIPVQGQVSEKEAWKSAKSSTIGGR